ncbi:MAG: carbamoyltransferase [Bacteroidales bacterium]|nr:carbamoyltransferase [Bacteroidales bacterium]
MRILGISAYYHDSAAALVVDGEIIAAAQEERFTRKKHDDSFPKNAIKFCLSHSGLELDDLDAVVYYEKPFLKFERLLETYYDNAPKGFVSFAKSIPIWTNEKLFLKNNIRKSLAEIMPYNKNKLKFLFTDHHLSHAASAFFPSQFEEAAIITVDGVGEWTSASIGIGKGNSISVLKEMHYPDSLGLLYSAFTWFLGFKVNSGEYKLMGLAPYGNTENSETQKFTEIIKLNILNVFSDGSIKLNKEFFTYSTRLRMINKKKWEKTFELKKRNPDDEITQTHCNLALAIQQITEEILLLMAKEAKLLTNSDNLVLAGGVALNSVANGKIQKSGIFKNIFIQPAAGDAGGALGASLAAEYIYFQAERETNNKDLMQGSFLGPEFNDLQIKAVLDKYEAKYKYYKNFDDLSKKTAKQINDGKIIAWFQDKMEFGPRALGNRSFIADARNAEMQKRINLKIKFRENFRPFAPAVLAEDTQEYFKLDADSPYMLLVTEVHENMKLELPDNYDEFGYIEKLYTPRSKLQATTHCDFSARVQTVHKNLNPKFYNLLKAFKEETGYGVLLNTSFNLRGEPMVCTPDDAFRCFMQTEADVLVINNFMILKNEQTDVKNKFSFNTKFKPD